MIGTRLTGLWPGLIAILWLAGSDRAAVGSAEEGAPRVPPLPLGAPELLVRSEYGVEIAAQILWSDPERIHVLGALPQCVLAVDPQFGLVDQLATAGPGPFDLDGPVQILSAGAAPDEILVHQVSSLRSIRFSRSSEPVQLLHSAVVTGSVVDMDGAWWLGPRLRDARSDDPVRIDVWRGPAAGADRLPPPQKRLWTAEHSGSERELVFAEYFTRLLRGPDGHLWRVALGERPRVDLIDTRTGSSEELEIASSEGALIAASVDAAGVLHLLTAGGEGSFGRRILRFAPQALPVLEGDRLWNAGAVDPTGTRWAAAEADLGDLLVYPIPLTRDPSSP